MFPKPQSTTTKTAQTMTAPTNVAQTKPAQQKPQPPPKPANKPQRQQTEQVTAKDTPKVKIQMKQSKGSDDPIQLFNRFGVLEGREGEGEELMELSGQNVQSGRRGSTSSSKKPQISKG